jgi:hypothetical protein
LVSLAKRLEGKPFHLLAAHCQRDTKENVVGYIKSKGLDAKTPNMTVTSMGGHPKVKGNGYVPYYMVFNQHGDLVQQHMCGDYHGGDGLKMIEVVDKLLKDVPAIYLGKEPFTTVPKLAKQIGAKKKLPAALAEIEKRLAASPGEVEAAELARLKTAVEDYRSRMLAKADALMATDPGEVIPTLSALEKELKGTALAEDVTTKLVAARKSSDLKTSITIAKSYEKAMKALNKKKEQTPKAREKTAAKLEKLIAGKESLPIAATIKQTIEELRG